MSGPPPNPNARRRNNREKGFTTLAGRRAEVPKLPTIKGHRWSAATRKAWASWWSSPQATRWPDDDIPQVALMAACYQRAITGDMEALKELRQWADRFGLSPLARLRNRWLVEGPDVAAAQGAEATVSNITKLDEYRDLYGA